MDFVLEPLPYPAHALEPHLGRETLTLHHQKHQGGYLEKLEELIGDTPQARESLEWLVQVSEGPVFENAAQVWNHDFYWRSMQPDGGGEPRGALADALQDAFGSLDDFQQTFLEAGTAHFGSGWLWLIADQGALRIITTKDADLPLRHGQSALLTADLWEHAYYLDYRNERPRYLEAFLAHLAHWEFAEQNWRGAVAGDDAPRRATR